MNRAVWHRNRCNRDGRLCIFLEVYCKAAAYTSALLLSCNRAWNSVGDAVVLFVRVVDAIRGFDIRWRGGGNGR
jgi:hypothetical protein